MTAGSRQDSLARDGQPRSILVTGGTGFVGRQVVRHLLDRGFRVTLIARVAGAATQGVDGPLNICSEIGLSVRSLVETVADEYGRRDLLRFGERPLSSFDPPCIVGERHE